MNNPYEHEDCDSDFGGCGDKCKRSAYEQGFLDGRGSRDGLRKALEDLRDCNWSIGIGDRMDPVREIARKALEADGEVE